MNNPIKIIYPYSLSILSNPLQLLSLTLCLSLSTTQTTPDQSSTALLPTKISPVKINPHHNMTHNLHHTTHTTHNLHHSTTTQPPPDPRHPNPPLAPCLQTHHLTHSIQTHDPNHHCNCLLPPPPPPGTNPKKKLPKLKQATTKLNI